eukprot:6552422-Prymnesium_polylepis.3
MMCNLSREQLMIDEVRDLPSSNVKTVVNAVYKLMQEELSRSACEQWCSILNAELGNGGFGPSCGTLDAEPEVVAVPRTWVPAKPKLVLALLDELVNDHADPLTPPAKKSIGTGGSISKLLARHAIERLRCNKGVEWLEASGELTSDQLNNVARLNQTLSRVAFDLLVYVHARAVELQREDGASVVLALHSSSETIVGRALLRVAAASCTVTRVAKSVRARSRWSPCAV